MFQGVHALLWRSLRIDARSWQAHLARVGLVLGIYIALIVALSVGSRFGAPGLRFFRSILWLNVAFMSLLGIGFFSTTISEEKEEDTLGLMQMAGLHPLSILLGKVGGRLCQALLLIAVQYPFTLLAVTMGGITSNQVQCAFVGLMAYMLLLAGLGVLCSTIAGNNRKSSGLMIAGLVAYLAIPYFANELHRFQIGRGAFAYSFWMKLLREVSNMCVFLQVPTIMTSTFNESLWSTQAISNVVIGLCLFLTAWAVFPLCTRNPASESISRGLIPHRQRHTRWLQPGRPGANPFLWKDYHFIGGGRVMIAIRCGFYLLLFGIVLLLCHLWSGSRPFSSPSAIREAIGIYQVLILGVFTIEAANIVTRTLHDEIRGQTLATLLMLPTTVPSLIYSKLSGALLACLPGFLCLLAASFLTEGGRDNTDEFLRRAAGWFFLAHFILVPNVSMVLALMMRWGCVPLAIGVAVGSLFGTIAIFEAIRIGPGDGLVGFIAILVFGVSVACHFWVVYRLPLVAARH